MTIKDLQIKYSKNISQIDFDLLLEFILDKSKEFILIHPEHKISPWQDMKIKYYTKQLLKHKPIDYIVGQKEFYGLNFKVNKHTLVPRPETEQVVELVKDITIRTLQENSKENFTIIDLGTGSGNIIVSIASLLRQLSSNIFFYASDISKNALKIARVNSQFHSTPVKFTQGSLLKPFQKLLTATTTRPVFSGCCGNVSASCNKLSRKDAANKNLIITANLPYLSQEIYNATAPNVKKYEPATALVSGVDGLNHYRELLQQTHTLTKNKKFSFKKIYLLLEISPEQKSGIALEVKKVFPSAEINTYKDLAQKWRIVKVTILI